MKDFEFFIPEEQKKYVSYILANSGIECECSRDKRDHQTISIIEYKDGTNTYTEDVLARERQNIVLPFEEGFKIIYNYYKKVKGWEQN